MSQEHETVKAKKKEKDDVLEFDLDLETIPIRLRDNKGTELIDCELREMDGFTRDKWLNNQKNRSQLRTGDVKDFTDVHASLIANCLYNSNTGEKFEIKKIRDFPAKTQSKLFDLCFKLNGLGKEGEETEKND